MTTKRFTKGYHTIRDTKENKAYDFRVDIICGLLNELHEENQDLKSFNKDLAENLSVCANARILKDNRIEKLEERIQRERISFRKTHERWSKEAETKIKELSEENEQLKQFIKDLTTKRTGRIDLANGYSYNVSAVLTNWKGDME